MKKAINKMQKTLKNVNAFIAYLEKETEDEALEDFENIYKSLDKLKDLKEEMQEEIEKLEKFANYGKENN